MNREDRNYRSVTAAALAASLLMLTLTLARSAVVGRMYGPDEGAAMDPALLRRLPLQIGDWAGEDAPLNEYVERATGADAHVSRLYSRAGAPGAVYLYAASGLRARALVGHRPEVCYVAAGWTLMDRHSLELPLGGEEKLTSSIFQFSRGGLGGRGMMVLYYYVVDGQYYGDVSLLRSKVWRGSGGVHRAAQVQIAVSTETLTVELAEQLVRAFAVDSAPLIAQLLESPENDDCSEQSREASQEG